MSANCLVTKLKGMVENNDLLKLNEFRLVGVNTSASVGNVSISSRNSTCRVLGDNNAVFAANNEKSITFSGAQSVNTTAETDIAISYPKIFRIDSASTINWNVDDLKYCKNLVVFIVRRASGDIANLPESLTQLTISTSGVTIPHQIYGDFSAIPAGLHSVLLEHCPYVSINTADFERLTSIDTLVIRYTPITGSLTGVIVANSLQTLRLQDCQLSGSISSFVNANPNMKSIRFASNPNLTGNVSELNVNTGVTQFEVAGTSFIGTAAQIKEKFPNASITDKDGGTA